MAALTKGYPFAFQVLGYLYWENRDDHTIEDILPEYDQCLDEYVKVKDWTDDQAAKIREIIGAEYKVEGDLRSEVQKVLCLWCILLPLQNIFLLQSFRQIQAMSA